MTKQQLDICLNGTNENPYTQFGLTQNPFPNYATYGSVEACLRLQSLGGDPIPHDRYKEYIRERLKGFSEEFIQGCIDRFVPGQYVRFVVTWDD